MKRIILYVLICFAFLAGVNAQADLKPVAMVKYHKTEPITLKQIKNRCAAVEFQKKQPLTVAERKEVVQQLINERLLLQAAEKNSITMSESQVNQQFNQIVSQQLGRTVSEAELAQIVSEQAGISLDEYMKQQNGMSVADFKQYMKSQTITQQYIAKTKADDLKKIPEPTDKDIRDWYEVNKSSFAQSDILAVVAFLVPKGAAAADAKKADTLIHDLYAQVKANPSASKELIQKSRSGKEAYQAGDAYIQKNAASAQQLGMKMDELLGLFSLTENSVSGIMENEAGFMFFLINEKRPARILELGDVIQPGTTHTVYEYIRNGLLSQTQNMVYMRVLNATITELRAGNYVQVLVKDADLDKMLTW